MHNGAYAVVEDAIAQKIRACALTQENKLRNPDPEFAAMRIENDDIAPLAAFLYTLNELEEESFRQRVLDATIRPDPDEEAPYSGARPTRPLRRSMLSRSDAPAWKRRLS